MLCQKSGALIGATLQLSLASAVDALADVPVNQMTEDRDYRIVMAMLIRELLAVKILWSRLVVHLNEVDNKY